MLTMRTGLLVFFIIILFYPLPLQHPDKFLFLSLVPPGSGHPSMSSVAIETEY